MIKPKHPDVMHLADMAFMWTEGSNANKVRAAVAAYEWGIENQREMFGMTVYPSPSELREALRK